MTNIKRILFLLWQPLVHRTNKVGAISDLFIWRNSVKWKTHFDLIDILKIINGPFFVGNNEVKIRIYNNDGVEILHSSLIFGDEPMNRIELSEILQETAGEVGLFTVTHCEINATNALADFGSNITDRGYVGYVYKDSPLKSYVHGNFDAIGYDLRSGAPLSLMGVSLFKRKYNLQYLFKANCTYEIFLTNPTRGKRFVNIIYCDVETGNREKVESYLLPKRGVIGCEFTVPPKKGWRVIIESRLVMARPVVFQLFESYADVFHG